MTNQRDARQFEARLQRLETLLQEVERYADPLARLAHTQEIVRAVLDLHGDGLARVLELLDSAGDTGAEVLDACAHDGVVEGLLLLHGLHPLDLEERVGAALESTRPFLRSHGGNVEFVGVEDGVVRLRLQGSCHSCPSSAVTMQQTIEEAIFGKAPEVTAVEVEGLDAVPENGTARFALPIL